jgi:Cu2+-exporting ATPase
MSGSSFIVAVNALVLKRLDLPGPAKQIVPAARPVPAPSPAGQR